MIFKKKTAHVVLSSYKNGYYETHYDELIRTTFRFGSKCALDWRKKFAFPTYIEKANSFRKLPECGWRLHSEHVPNWFCCRSEDKLKCS